MLLLRQSFVTWCPELERGQPRGVILPDHHASFPQHQIHLTNGETTKQRVTPMIRLCLKVPFDRLDSLDLILAIEPFLNQNWGCAKGRSATGGAPGLTTRSKGRY